MSLSLENVTDKDAALFASLEAKLAGLQEELAGRGDVTVEIPVELREQIKKSHASILELNALTQTTHGANGYLFV